MHRRIAIGVYRRKSSSGQTYYLVYGGRDLNGKIQWFTCKTEDAARAKRQEVKTTVANEGKAVFDLDASQRKEAMACFRKLEPTGVSLAHAVDGYLRKVHQFLESPTVGEIVAGLIKRLESNRRRPRAVQDAKQRLTKFAASFPDRRLADISAEEVAKWLDSIGGSSGTQVNYRKRLKQLWRFALRKKWCSENPLELLEPISVERANTKIFTVDECLRLLRAASAGDASLRPYICLGLFAGLRPEEIEKLTWDAVKLDRKQVVVDERVAKKRSRRTVEITKALAAWIKHSWRAQGPVTPDQSPTLRWRLKLLRKAAEITSWPHDGLRHTYGSYHLALYENAAKTALQMGNSEDVVHRHYKALVDPADVPRFWGLRPKRQSSSPTAARR